MQNLENVKEDFNSENVLFCTKCLSLRIRGDEQLSYCDSCSSTAIQEINIVDWEKLYESRYNKKYIIKNGEKRKKTYL